MQNHTYKNPNQYQNQNPYKYQNNEQMDVSFFNYFSTFTLGLMCYTFFNPGFIYDMSIFLAYSFAKTMITGYDVYSKYIYRPYRKHVHKHLMNFLNIDDGLYEIEIVKDGNVIHRFKTMADFIKNNPIKFICEDGGSGSDYEKEQTQTQPSSELETPIDADLTNVNVNIHEPDKTSENRQGQGQGDGKEQDDDTDEVDTDDVDTDEVDTDEDTDDEVDTEDKQSIDDADEFNGDNLILEPTEYDFVLRTMYFEDDSVNIPFGFCLKYETFRKSDMKQKYTYEQLKELLSKRRFIGIHLKTDGQDYIINLTNPINYYIVDNTILDYSFLKMYLFKRYSVILGNNYTLSCIDNFIEMYTFEQGKKIFIKKTSFKIIDDETYKIVEDTESSSSNNTGSESESETNIQPNEVTNDTDIEIVEYNLI